MKKLLKILIFAALVGGAVKLVSAKKAEWQGLTETQVRDKLQAKLGARMPSEKVDEISNKVVETMRQRGALGEEAPSEA
jgi:hypothetical protein